MLLMRGALGALPMTLSPTAQNNLVQIREVMTRAKQRDYADHYRAQTTQRAEELVSSIVTQACFGTQSAMDPAIQRACNKFLAPERILLPLGVLDMLGVPFSIHELLQVGEDGELAKTYTPTDQQRFLASYHAYLTSQQTLLTYAGYSSTGQFEDFVLSPDFQDIINKSIGGSLNDLVAGKATVYHKGPIGGGFYVPIPAGTFQLQAPGFGMRVIDDWWLQPTQDELTGKNGIAAYYARGGFVLWTPAVTEQAAIHQQPLSYNVGYFRCSDDGRLAVVTQDVPDEGHGWLAYVAFGTAQYTIKVRMKNRSTWESVKNAVGSAVHEAADLICKVAPLAATVAKQTASVKSCSPMPPIVNPTEAQKAAAGCTSSDTPAACAAKLKKCKEGTPGCTCTQAATASGEQMALAAGSQFLTSACAPGATTGIACTVPPPPAPNYLPWIIGGLAVAGFLYMRKTQAVSR